MTERLYYAEPYRRQFTACVQEQLTWEEHPAVILDRTAFYPSSGGQPADRGRLDGVDVIAVAEREADGAVIHVLSDEILQKEVEGEIDWDRRFDHMQQHTGQHILSAAFQEEIASETVGFHLGASSSTIDVDTADLEMDDVLPVEQLANRIIWADRTVSAHFVDETRLSELSIERPSDVQGPIRLVKIAGLPGQADSHFDVNPCGGTHVARAGEIGMIKIIGLEHQGAQTRIEFLCGERALQDYERKNRTLSALAKKLTVGYWELNDAVERLQDENKERRRSERELRQRLLDLEAAQLLGTAILLGPYRVVGTVWQGRSPDEVRILALKLVEEQNVVALLFSVDDRTNFCFARAETVDLDVNELLQEACARLEGKGGGRPQIAQGSAPAADLGRVKAVLDDLEASL